MSARTFEEYSEDSELGGIKHIGRTKSSLVRRSVWGILFLLAVVMLIYVTSLSVIKYLSFDHITTYEVNYLDKMDFPAITICNTNKHKLSSLTLTDIAIMGQRIGMTDEKLTLKYKELYPEDWYNRTFLNRNWTEILSSVTSEDYNITDFYDRTSHQFEDLVLHCSWQGKTCNKSSWSTSFDYYGKCYTFNKADLHTLEKAGAENGLKLVLDVEEHEYLSTYDNQGYGIKFLPHQPIEPPLVKELGYAAAPGYLYQIALQRKEVSQLPAPYGICVEDHRTAFYENYTVPGCRIECETKAIFDKCGCKLVESPGDHPVCTVSHFNCAEEVLADIEQSDACVCQNPCEIIQYKYQASMLKVRDVVAAVLKTEHSIPSHLTSEDIIIMDIYFDSLSAEYVEQTPGYELQNVFSDLGGNMGLYIGASFLGFIYMIEYICGRILSLFVIKLKNTSEVKPMEE